MLRPWKLQIELDLDNKEVPMYKQLANQVQKMIETGILKTGDLLPASREMAEQLHVSRKTVVSAMELLVFSGWLENRERVGLFVRKHGSMVKAQEKTSRLVVNDGYPDTQLVPFVELSRAYRQLFNRAARWKMLGYADPQGNQKLRVALTQALCQERGMVTVESEIMLTRGSQQALYLIAHALFQPGDVVVMENPTYQNARRAFESAGMEVLSIAVDEDGLQVDVLADLLANHDNIKALYVTPRYQYPTTVTLSLSRRRQLAELITKYDLMVLEDDFGCHFGFSDHHLKPLSVLLPKTHYLYIGTFSKILAPALRMGFVVSSDEVIARLANYRQLVDIQGDNVMERAILELINNGELKRHLRRSTKVYRERLDAISNLIEEKLGEKVKYHKPKGGLALWIEMNSDPSVSLQQRGIQASVERLSDSRYGLRIGYASMQPEEMDLLINALSEGISSPLS